MSPPPSSKLTQLIASSIFKLPSFHTTGTTSAVIHELKTLFLFSVAFTVIKYLLVINLLVFRCRSKYFLVNLIKCLALNWINPLLFLVGVIHGLLIAISLHNPDHPCPRNRLSIKIRRFSLRDYLETFLVLFVALLLSSAFFPALRCTSFEM